MLVTRCSHGFLRYAGLSNNPRIEVSSSLHWLQSIMGESYSSTEVVLVAEVMKVIVSAYLTVTEKQQNEGNIAMAEYVEHCGRPL